MQKLIVVEDDLGIQSQLKWSFDNYEIIFAVNRVEAIAAVRRYEPAVVLLDLGLPPDPENASEGLAVLDGIMKLAPETKVIVVTGNDDRSNAVRAIASGAYDFYQKPIDMDVLSLIVARASHVYDLEKENHQLLMSKPSPLDGVIASSPQMLKVCKVIEKIAPANVTTLILGESGTGKEVLARALHNLSDRVDQSFVAINCAAIPENLLESELFGYEKGAFTGAVKQTIGKFEQANGGTLFLDEIGDLPLSLQAKLLRFLQERVIERVGGRKEIAIDVRVVCATHQNIDQLIQNGSFREDLYYRISEITVNIPPLRERAGDAILMAKVFLKKFSSEFGKKMKGFTSDATNAVRAHSWRGNVRELENCIKRAVIMSDDNLLTLDDLELPRAPGDDEVHNLRQVREKAEREAVSQALALCEKNVSKASELLGVSRPTMYDLVEKYGL
ncbi:Response regulatory protein [hydrothermal vent metagenome]|uniref:Response regulatory protein n=1 Tax=hydrothermal vent metagenome TaxID=652676 RepID=A0A3B0ZB24_9ZZZZ